MTRAAGDPPRPLRRALTETGRRGAWLPAAVFGGHVIASLAGAYLAWPPLDGPMHVAGGVAIAWFFAVAVESAQRFALLGPSDPRLAGVAVLGLTALAAIAWELAEWSADRLFDLSAQLGLGDTLLDLVLGVAGGACVALWVARRPSTPGPDQDGIGGASRPST